jgi:hypothetical protein
MTQTGKTMTKASVLELRASLPSRFLPPVSRTPKLPPVLRHRLPLCDLSQSELLALNEKGRKEEEEEAKLARREEEKKEEGRKSKLTNLHLRSVC